jgi:mono/diheme cytochrome c family protein
VIAKAIGVLAWVTVLLAVIGSYLTARVLDETRAGFEYMPDMAHAVPYESFAPNPIGHDGKTLQPAPAGTVPRGFHPLHYAATELDAVRAGRELENPVPLSTGALAQGRVLYETFCLVCHGEHGGGDGPLVPRIPTPPAYSSERVRGMAPGQIFHVISRGSGRMPSYAGQIPAEQRWLIVHYVLTLRQPGSGAR